MAVRRTGDGVGESDGVECAGAIHERLAAGADTVNEVFEFDGEQFRTCRAIVVGDVKEFLV